MASPCELLVDTDSKCEARSLLEMTAGEAQRIERHFSRYLPDSIVSRINDSAGKPIEVDAETATLLDFADQCHDLSNRLFDVTAGVLRRAWQFDGSDRVPAQSLIDELLPLVGWHRVRWERPMIRLPQHMQIDFGGIGKEYAVDRTVRLLAAKTDAPLLVNFGGDLHASAAPRSGQAWQVGIEQRSAVGTTGLDVDSIEAPSLGSERTSAPRTVVHLMRGALTTSGDAYRFVQRNGIRYGHVLHPLTGWPAPGAPQSVTVASSTCTEAGVLSTLAMLKGQEAEAFLDGEGVRYWCQRATD